MSDEQELMDFGMAMTEAKFGNKVQRQGWNGKNMFVFYIPEVIFRADKPPLSTIFPTGTKIKAEAHLMMRTATGSIIPWLASQSDVLATDWTLFE